MSLIVFCAIMVNLDAKEVDCDTLWFTRIDHPDKSVTEAIDSPVIILNGSVRKDLNSLSELFHIVKPDSIAKLSEYKESSICNEYGEDAVRRGILFVVTKDQADKIMAPKRTFSDTITQSSFSVDGGEEYDRAPHLKGESSIDGFDRWLCSQVIGKGEEGISSKDNTDYGPVTVSFIIDRQGKLKKPALLEKRSASFTKAVKEMLRHSPEWSPAVKDGNAVPVVVVYPITCFSLVR